MKTLNEWFQALPPYYRELAVLTVSKYNMEERQADKLSTALLLLPWGRCGSLESTWAFWSKVYGYYNGQNSKLPGIRVEQMKELRKK